MKPITKAQLDKMVASGKIKKYHASLARGYFSRTVNPDEVLCNPYNGKFGKGYTYESAYLDSTRYHLITYFILDEK